MKMNKMVLLTMALSLCFSGNAQVNGYFGKRLGLKGYVGSGFSFRSYGATTKKLENNLFGFGPNPLVGLGAGFVVNRKTMLNLEYVRMATSVTQSYIWLVDPRVPLGNANDFHLADYLFRLNANSLRLDIRQKLGGSSQPAPDGWYVSGFVQRSWFRASAIDSVITYPAYGVQPVGEIPASRIDYSIKGQNFLGMSFGHTAAITRSLLIDFSYEGVFPLNFQAISPDDPNYDLYNVPETNSSKFRSAAIPKALLMGAVAMRVSLWFFFA